MKILNMIIQNFKGIKDWRYQFNGSNATILGANGTGKTSVFDAMLWLLFNKNSLGETDFDLRPHDGYGEAIKGLSVVSNVEFDIDGECVVLKKENIEKVVKGVVEGFTNNFWIDDVPKKKKEFDAYISEIMPEDTFKMLADLSHFNDKLHWTDRRALLLEMAELLERMNNRDIDDYKKVLTVRKKGYVKERDGIQPRIDERQQTLDSYEPEDVKDLEFKRDAVNGEIAGLQKKREEVVESESARQKIMDDINAKKSELSKRESFLANDTSKVQEYIDEKADIEKAIAAQTATLSKAKTAIVEQGEVIKNIETKISNALSRKASVVAEYDAFEATESDEICSLCKQKLPAESLKKYENAKKETLDAIAERGKKEHNIVKELKLLLEGEKKVLADRNEFYNHESVKLDEAKQQQQERTAMLDEKINANETVKPEDDDTWKQISSDIQKLEEALGDPVTEQLQEIDQCKRDKDIELYNLNQKLSSYDTATKARERIAELGARETELAQEIADIDSELKDIANYKVQQNGLIEDAVNGMFKDIYFRLFKTLVNGNTEDDCTAVYKPTGQAYPGASTGERIIMGIDVVNVLSKHFEVSVPMFVDNAESLTKEIESESQVIRLVADIDESQLKVV
jgi:DNA repair exonuclease SbcCD ATPase subunit